MAEGRPLPKFGEWDVNNPATAEGFTMIFSKASDDKRSGGNGKDTPSSKNNPKYKQAHKAQLGKPQSKKWWCCIHPSPPEK